MRRPQLIGGLVVLLAFSVLIQAAHAATLTWDGTGSGGTGDGAGTWDTDSKWWNSSVDTTWTSGSDAIFGHGGAGGNVTLNGPITVNSITFNSFTSSSTYTLGTAGQTMTISNGITINSGTYNVSLVSPISLAGAQTWSNSISVNYGLNVGGGVANNGYMLTFDGPGQIKYLASTVSGSGGVTKNGTGAFETRAAHTYTGPTIINQGTYTLSGNVSFLSTGGSGALGQSSPVASNLVLGSGATLADGQGGNPDNCDRLFTINGTTNGAYATIQAPSGNFCFTNRGSLAYGVANQTRTLILDGTAASCIFAPAIGDNGTGSVSVAKTGSGTWQLTGTNSYSGVTTLSAGELIVNTSNNLGAPAAKLVFNGGTLQITNTTLTNLTMLNHPIVCNPGKAFSININNASTTFAVDHVISGTTISLAKSGAGTLVLTVTTNFTGQITIGGGMLRYDDGQAIPATPLLNNGALIVNRSGTLTQGVNFHSTMGGAGSLTNSGAGTLVLNNINIHSGITRATAGTITLSHPLALMNSAIDTSGAGTITLSGVACPTFGGISGSGNIGSITGYGSVTNLTLNPGAGLTFTNSGVVANGSGATPLTMAGAGTQVLQGMNTYSGATCLNAGTLELSGSGSIINTAITFSGGGLKLSNTAVETGSGRISDSAAVTARGGTLTYNNTSGADNYAETIGSVTLNSGQLDIVESVNQVSSGSQTITLSGLSQSGSGSVTFSAATTGPQDSGNKNMIVVTGGGTTTAGQIIGPWATVGTAANAQTDYAVYGSDYVTNANIAASAENLWSTAANAYTLSGATTLTGTRTITALRYSGGAQTLALSSYNLQTYGILNGGSGTLTVSGTGAVTTPTGGGNLYLTAGNKSITISAPINDNTGALTLVKSGSGVLTLSSTTSTYSGGTVINAGTLSIANDTNFGAASGGITVNGSCNWYVPTPNSYNNDPNNVKLTTGSGRALTLNNGAIVTVSYTGLGDYGINVAGPVAGTGGFTENGNQWNEIFLTSTNNTFTGPVTLYAGSQIAIFYAASIGDGSYIKFRYGNNAGADATYGKGGFYFNGGNGPMVLNNRYILMANSAANGADVIYNNNANSAYTLTINTDVQVNTPNAAQTLQLDGTNTGNNVFAGKITDGPGTVVSLAKGGGAVASTGKWIISGRNTYSGATTVSAGTLEIGGAGVLGAGGAYPGNISISGTFLCSSSATQTWSGVISGTQPFEVGGSGTLKLAGNNTYSGATTVTNGVLLGVTGGSCSNSAITVTNTPGNIAAFGVVVSDNTKQFTCANLTFKTNGVGAQLRFNFDVVPSTNLAPLYITGNLTCTGTPVAVASSVRIVPGTYPLVTVAGTVPTEVPVLNFQGPGNLAWGWTGNKTLLLTVNATGTMIIIR